jgi:hypothetical protein
VENSENGKVNAETIFEYKQQGDLVTADYHGGTILYGKIIAKLKGNNLEMLYQCITIHNELKAGKAFAEISLIENKKMKLKLNWEWLDNKNEKGVSEYIEN